jgi:signal transduction histidine kinase/ligand-binding sensor domain-containing protein
MQRTTFILACFLFCVNCFSQQYPFIHYTPKDGLLSNQVRNIYQDSRGRLYFSTMSGLSVYDGARFINYTSRNGLDNEMINCVMEMGEDSIWIVTNGGKIKCLVNGKLKPVTLAAPNPVINCLFKDQKGIIYAACEQGLYILNKDRFTRLPFTDSSGRDRNSVINYMCSVGNYLLVQRDHALLPEQRNPLYLYHKTTKKIVAEVEGIIAVNGAPDGRVWVSTKNNIRSLDTAELKKGKILLQELPARYNRLSNLGGYFILFDNGSNCWLGDQDSILIKTTPDGNITSFTAASGLSIPSVNAVFEDRERIIWIAINNGGVDKLVQDNISIITNPFRLSSVNHISYLEEKNHVLIYSENTAKAAIIQDDSAIQYLHIENAHQVEQVLETPTGIFGTWKNLIYKMIPDGNVLRAEMMHADAIDQDYNSSLVDKNGNLLLCGRNNLTVVMSNPGRGPAIFREKINMYADQAALDSKGNIWVATRAGELITFEPRPDNPSNYLLQKDIFSKELSGISPRSITIDRNNNIWIGSRSHGINVFSVQNGVLTRQFGLTTASGLSDNFTVHLACDPENNIWASSYSGLDKISIQNGKPVIENLTQQNNIYQKVSATVIDKNNTAWALLSNGLIRIAGERIKRADYTPWLMISLIKAGKDTITTSASLPHGKNSLSFYFAATSFLDEKKIVYSYRLLGGNNQQWSEPSNNAAVSFADLPPGSYTLKVKAAFPAGRYPDQVIDYQFSISAPWWQTLWFRAIAGFIIIGLIIIGFRFFYRRSWEKQRQVLEKQQAIEKERTRIATDMHDDLGAGLSRIKFLSQSILKKNEKNEGIITDLEKIAAFSDEMSEKMGEIVWALNERNDTLADLVAYTRFYAVEYLGNHNIQCEADTRLHLPDTFITGDMRRNIFLSVKECLHNIVKHAGATSVCFSIHSDGEMRIIIHDNGRGIDWDHQRAFSNGMQNVDRRMKEINGTVTFENEEGTKVSLTIPLNL